LSWSRRTDKNKSSRVIAAARHCALYEDELQRVWPLDEENRRAKIEQFGNENGFRLVYYKPGLCAIFEEERVNTKSGTINRKICAD
jgi:hypothetical protein